MGSGLVPENARSFVVGDQNEPCDSVERKLVRLSATGLHPSFINLSNMQSAVNTPKSGNANHSFNGNGNTPDGESIQR